MASTKQMNINMYLTYLLVALLIVGAYFLGVYKTKADLFSAGSGTTAQGGTAAQGDALPEAPTQLPDDDWQKLLVDPAYAFGEDNAPVTIVEFTDYQCPFCQRAFQQTYPQLVSDYVDSGKARYLIRDLPLTGLHPNAEDAAVAARCAGKEGKYLEMHDMLFENQQAWEGLSDAAATFAQYGDSLGINIRSCQNDTSVLDAVQADEQLAASLGATGTPTFFINGQLLVGAQPYASFQQVIEEQL